MVILNWVERNLGWNHMHDFKIEWAWARVPFEITSMISDQNCTTQGSITTLLHPFWSCSNTGHCQFKYLIDAVLSWFEIKFILILGGKNNSFGNKGSKICHMILFVSHFPVIWLVTLNKPWNLIGCCVFTEPSSLTGKKRCNLKQKMVWFVDNRLEPIRLQGPPVISKWV